jgi:hypothetical protein
MIMKHPILKYRNFIPVADNEHPLYPQKLALISPTSGGRSVGIVRSRSLLVS